MEDKSIAERIADLRKELNAIAGSEENGRIKAIVNTKLQEAELFAKELFNKEA